MNPAAYAALFGAGVASFANPCVLPLVPAYIAMIASVQPRASPHRRVIATGVFVAGFTTVFAALGVIAEIVGRSTDALLSSIQRVGGVVIIALGLIQLGMIRRLRSSWHLNTAIPDGPLARPFVMGLTFGAAWSPCVGPLLGAALIAVANSSTKSTGIALLVAYTLGVGVPFVAASLAFESAPTLTRRVRRTGRALHQLTAATLIMLGVLLTTGRYNALVSALNNVVPHVR